MSLHRRAARRDAIETDCIDLLEAAGWSCLQISVKDGPDTIAAKRVYLTAGALAYPLQRTVAFEWKRKGGKLRPGQKAWHESWPGEVVIIRSISELQAWLRDQTR